MESREINYLLNFVFNFDKYSVISDYEVISYMNKMLYEKFDYKNVNLEQKNNKTSKRTAGWNYAIENINDIKLFN